MSALQLAELDYLYKKNAASTVKTDNATSTIIATSETIFTSPIVSSDNVWTESATLELGPNIASSIVSLKTRVKMTSARGVGPNPDIVALTGMAWTSGITNWVDKKFHIGFAPKFEVASGDNPAPGDYKTIDNSSDYPMIFDYKSGVLTFLVTPYAANGVDLTAKTGTDTTWHVYITGYTYSGRTLNLEGASQQQFSDPIAIGTGAGNYLQGVVDITEFADLRERPDKDISLNWTTVGSNAFDVSAYMTANNLNYCRLQMTVVGGGGGSLSGVFKARNFDLPLKAGGGSGGIIKNLIIENVSGVINGTVGGTVSTVASDYFYVSYEVTSPLPIPIFAGNGSDSIVSVNGKIYTASGGQEGGVNFTVFPNLLNWFALGGNPGIPNGVRGGAGNNGGTFINAHPDIYPFGSGGQFGVNQGRGTQGVIKLTLKFFTRTVEVSPFAGSIAIGVNAGAHIQQKNAIAVGYNAGQTGQGSNAIAIGSNSGLVGQGKPGPLGSYHVFQWTTTGIYSIDTAGLTGSPFAKAEITIIGGGGSSAYYINPATPGGGGGGGGVQFLTLANVSGIITLTVGAGSPGGQISERGGSTVANVVVNGTSQTYTATGGTDGTSRGSGSPGTPNGFVSRGPLGALGFEIDLKDISLVYGVRSAVEGGIGAGGNYSANSFSKGVDGGILVKLYYNGGANNDSAIAIGPDAGKYYQNTNAIAIGNSAGIRNQGVNSIAIGNNAGSQGITGQFQNSICIGTNAGIAADRSVVPAENSVSIGINSQIPGINSVAIGCGSRGGTIIAGTSRGYAAAVGYAAGANENGVAIGREASADGVYSVAIGYNSKTRYDGINVTGESAGVAIGTGSRSYGNGLALGRAAEAKDGQITLNANVGYLTPATTTPGLYVNPVRNGDRNTATSGIMEYNASTKEITYRDLLPKYSVIMWFSTGTPPPGWVLCDGENGTPDMRSINKVMASGNGTDLGGDDWQTGQYYFAAETGQNKVPRQRITFIMKLY